VVEHLAVTEAMVLCAASGTPHCRQNLAAFLFSNPHAWQLSDM
jgi:hypothetical protein